MMMHTNRGHKLSSEWSKIHLSKAKFDGKLCYYYQPAAKGVNIAAIFENPTHLEFLAKRPVVGETGVNLYRLLEYLKLLGFHIKYRYPDCLDKMRICIVNATNVYGNVDGLSKVAKQHLIASNYPALKCAVENKSLILVFGETADLASDLLKGKGLIEGSAIVIAVYHLSPRVFSGLNVEKINEYLDKNSKVLLKDCDNTKVSLGLKLIASYIFKKYGELELDEGESSRYAPFNEFVKFVKGIF